MKREVEALLLAEAEVGVDTQIEHGDLVEALAVVEATVDEQARVVVGGGVVPSGLGRRAGVRQGSPFLTPHGKHVELVDVVGAVVAAEREDGVADGADGVAETRLGVDHLLLAPCRRHRIENGHIAEALLAVGASVDQYLVVIEQTRRMVAPGRRDVPLDLTVPPRQEVRVCD